jgi:uncharacterized protein (DUF488 family)
VREPHGSVSRIRLQVGRRSDHEATSWRLTMSGSVYTVGHSTHASTCFLDLIVRHGVTAIADVRSQPYSRMNPQFNRETLRASLKKAGISYVFLGRELGARSEDRTCYLDGKVQYDRLAQTDLFREGIDRIATGVSNHRIALMCAEKDPLTCHRSILVCRSLVEREFHVEHILEDGRVESHGDSLTRLLLELGIEQADLLAAKAYARRGEQIAYVEKPATGGVTRVLR